MISSQANRGAYTAESYQRRDEHKPRTPKGEDEQNYIVALLTDAEHHHTMTSLRNKHFPSKLNKLQAHIALFHALPGSQLDTIRKDLCDVASSTSKFSIHTASPFRMKQGVGIHVSEVDAAKGVREELKRRWGPFLSQQDRGGFRAHYTIQNKVEDEHVVDNTLKEVTEHFKGSRGIVEGLRLYQYNRGFWRKEADFMFQTNEGEE